jgi:tRNA uridine 5-carboxymethylaminomethyl modification enzyme
MFTSRAEYRLQLRADNADQRLTPTGISLGCVGEARRVAFEKKRTALDGARSLAEGLVVSPTEAARRGVLVKQDGVRRNAFELMGYSDLALEAVVAAFPPLGDLQSEIVAQLARDAAYVPYVARQGRDIARLRRDEEIELPRTLDYRAIGGLSSELLAKLELVRPETLAQAERIEGMTPAALTQILMRVRQQEARRAAS